MASPGGKLCQGWIRGPNISPLLHFDQVPEEGKPSLHEIFGRQDLKVVHGVLGGHLGEQGLEESPRLLAQPSPATPPRVDDVVRSVLQSVENLLVVCKTAVSGNAEAICPAPLLADYPAADLVAVL